MKENNSKYHFWASMLPFICMLFLSCTTTTEVSRQDVRPMKITIKIENSIFQVSVDRKISKYKVYESDDKEINTKEVPNSRIDAMELVKTYNAHFNVVANKPNMNDKMILSSDSDGFIKVPVDKLLTFLYDNTEINQVFSTRLIILDLEKNTGELHVNLEDIFLNEIKNNLTYKNIKKKQTKELAIIQREKERLDRQNAYKIKSIESIKIDKIINIKYCKYLQNRLYKQHETEKNDDVKRIISNKLFELDNRITQITQDNEAKQAERERIAEERQAEKVKIAEQRRAERERLNQRCEGSWNEIFICECSKECVQRNRPCDDDIHRLTNLWRAGVNALLPYHIQQLRSLCPRTCGRSNL